jgi:hypothetical protein
MPILGDRNGDAGASTPLSVLMEGPVSSPPQLAFSVPTTSMTSPSSDLVGSGELNEIKSDWTTVNATFGPSVFERRRQLWVSGQRLNVGLPAASGLDSSIGRNSSRRRDDRPKRSNPSAEALKRLDDVLASPGVDADDEVWRRYLSDVHRRLVGGNRLKKGLRLSQAVSVLAPCSPPRTG